MGSLAMPMSLRNVGWMPLDVNQYLRKTAYLNPQESTFYLHRLVDEWIAKRMRCHIRASKAARARWKLLPFDTSIEDAQADAPSIDKLVEKNLSGALRWISNAHIRSEKARLAAQARWARIEHAASIAQAPKNVGENPPHTPPRELNTVSNPYPLKNPPLPREAAASLKPQGAAGQPGEDPTPHQTPGEGRKWPLSGFLERLKSRSDRRVDPRTDRFREEVLRFWAEFNPQDPQCPWLGKDEKALRRLLEGSPSLTLEGFQRWLHNRGDSQITPSDLPRNWLDDLARYASGPLDRYKQPLRRPRIY